MKKLAIVLLFCFPVNLFAASCSLDGNELKKCQDKNASYERSIVLYKKNEDLFTKKSTLLESQNLELTKALESAREVSTVEKAGYFLLGIFAGGLVIYGVKKIY